MIIKNKRLKLIFLLPTFTLSVIFCHAEEYINTLNLDSYTLNLNQISTSTQATTSTQIHTLLTDHLNSIEKVLDFNSGDVISTSTYTSFGTQTKEGKTNSNRGYTNQQSDQDTTGLNYYNARYQNPSYGIFISSDEATANIGNDSSLKEITNLDTQSYLHDPQGLNSYSYVKNNPIHYTDPDGNFGQAVLLGAASGIDLAITDTDRENIRQDLNNPNLNLSNTQRTLGNFILHSNDILNIPVGVGGVVKNGSAITSFMS